MVYRGRSGLIGAAINLFSREKKPDYSVLGGFTGLYCLDHYDGPDLGLGLGKAIEENDPELKHALTPKLVKKLFK